jgi:hypothetical protein
MKPWRVPLLLVVAAVIVCGGSSAIVPQNPVGNCHYFVETGHYVCSDFLNFFETRGKHEIFGYPLTEAYTDPDTGLWVQFFQRARMELHPSLPEPYRVQLGLLVDELGYASQYPPAKAEAIPAFNSALHHYFPETGHVVSYAFLSYYRDKGGLDIFGYPRSEFVYENGYMVQYFQRAKMEWHPEGADGPEMRLANLGEVYTERFGIPGGADRPLPPPTFRDGAADIAPQSVTALRATANVRRMITGGTGTQTVYVYVNGQQGQAIERAHVDIVVQLEPQGETHDCGLTDGNGFASCTFDLNSPTPGRKVVVDVNVTYGALTQATSTFFLPWW